MRGGEHRVPGIRRAARRVSGAALSGVLLATTVAVSSPAEAVPHALAGTVESGGDPLEDHEVTLYRTTPHAAPEAIGSDITNAAGEFTIDHEVNRPEDDRIFYIVARSGEVVLATVLGHMPADTVTVNPRTTVATAYTMAQFLDEGAVVGPVPGVPNGASMAPNVADPVTGDIGEVLDTSPNGADTSARNTFNSLANAVAACVDDTTACDSLLTAATPQGRLAPADSLQALRNIVREPGRNVDDIYAISEIGPTPYAPAREVEPAAWTLALRFDGDGQSMSGPGNFVLDHDGTMWVANNYAYAPVSDLSGACASQQLLRFAPNGEYVPGSPYEGGGLNGAGYGIARDRHGDIWVSNFGFAAVECPDQPPHNTLSQFRPDGTPVSADNGYDTDGVDWPQGIRFSDNGDLWVANCANDSVTLVPDGDTSRARPLTDIGVEKPFDMAFGADANTYVTGTASDNVAVLQPDGTPTPDSPLAGFHRPMGIIENSHGELWVANSGLVDLPCPDKDVDAEPPPSLGHIDTDGTVTMFGGGGLLIPWGVSVDGHDNVWVSNFGGERLSAFCGRDNSPHCPEGVGKGDPLSPDVTGYFFDGLTRSTATEADTAGNMWVTNNWKEIPPEQNPGGYQVVVYLGLAGPNQPAAPEPRPEPHPEPEPESQPEPSTTPAPEAVAVEPRFTG